MTRRHRRLPRRLLPEVRWPWDGPGADTLAWRLITSIVNACELLPVVIAFSAGTGAYVIPLLACDAHVAI